MKTKYYLLQILATFSVNIITLMIGCYSAQVVSAETIVKSEQTIETRLANIREKLKEIDGLLNLTSDDSNSNEFETAQWPNYWNNWSNYWNNWNNWSNWSNAPRWYNY